MNYEMRMLIRQAKMLTPGVPDTTGLRNEVLKLACRFKIKERCNHDHGFAVSDPAGKLNLPAAACGPCTNYINTALDKDPESAEAHERIAIAIARTWEALFAQGMVVRVVAE